MESIRCHFFNGTDLNSKKSIWVRWNNVLASKEKGGLGVSSLFALNRALLFKWAWQFFTQKESLWARVISAIHGVDGGIGSEKKIGRAYIWCSITKEMERLASQDIDLFSFMQKNIGNGSNTVFWSDIWRGDSKLKDDFPRLYALEKDKCITVAAKFAHANFLFSFRRLPRSGAENDQWLNFLKRMEDILLNSMDDRWCWNLTGSGDFNVASARKFVDDKRMPVVSSKTRWIKEVPIKVNILAWKVRLDSLPTRWNLSRRGMDLSSICCPLCDTAVESSTHLFFDYHVFKVNFRKICNWWNVSVTEFSSFDGWVDWICNLKLPSKLKSLLEGVCYGLWWFIWDFRNKTIFGVASPSKANIFDDVVLHSFYWCRYRCKDSFSWVDYG